VDGILIETMSEKGLVADNQAVVNKATGVTRWEDLGSGVRRQEDKGRLWHLIG
jgi:hypothetical protein